MRRKAIAVVFLFTLSAALLALPVAEAAKPVRVVFGPGAPDVFPAGLGCPFDVGRAIDPDSSFGIQTSFSDGRVKTVGHANVTFTNLDTDKSYLQRSRFQFTGVYDEATNALLDQGGGRFYFQFYPGDQGPFGEVGENGAMYIFYGRASYTLDFDTELVTSWEYSGEVTDLCAILAAE